jgi:geranylgeranyl reductase family protein
VGAGPAGSSAAHVCAKAGLDTLLLDMSVFPREKLCAGAVSARSIRLLHAIGVDLPNQVIERKIYGIQLMGPDWEPFTIRSDQLLAYTVKRKNFDHFLVKQAIKAGANFLDGHRVTDVELKKDQVVCHTSEGSFMGRLIIGADGAAGRVARITGLRGRLDPTTTGICVEVEIPLTAEILEQKIDTTLLTLWFPWVPLGYFWVFPRRQSLSIGLGGMASFLKNLPRHLRVFTKRYAKLTGLQIPPIHDIGGHPLPATGFSLPIVADRVLLAGDAAGFVDMFTGQGICYALESGMLAGKIATKAVRCQDFTTSTLDEYPALVKRRFGDELNTSISVAHFIHKHLYGTFRLAKHLRCFSQFITNLATGHIDYNRMLRNPISLIGRLLVAELRTRIIG